MHKLNFCTIQAHDELHGKEHCKIDIEQWEGEAAKQKRANCDLHDNLPYIKGCKICLTLMCTDCLQSAGACAGDGTSKSIDTNYQLTINTSNYQLMLDSSLNYIYLAQYQ